MRIVKIMTPAIGLALSALAVASCTGGNQQSTVKSEPKTEMVAQTTQDSFEKQAAVETSKKEIPWWQKGLGVIGGIAMIFGINALVNRSTEKMMKNPGEAEAYLNMTGDNYLDS
ncbi:hypothetical protein IJ750_00840 [bacterium]|nr:hypothetical protein [bacterium]